LLSLAAVAGDGRMWCVPESDRRMGLAVGQADLEWPLQLLAAVGEVSVLPSRWVWVRCSRTGSSVPPWPSDYHGVIAPGTADVASVRPEHFGGSVIITP
jgi:hypothetical protein